MRRLALVITLAATVAPLAACGGGTGGSGGNGELIVAAAFFPLAELARGVGGDTVRVVTIVPPGEEAHEYEPTPKQLTDLSDAGVVLYLGNGFQSGVEKALQSLPSSARRVDLLDAAQPLLPVDGSSNDDPHVWLSPKKMAAMAGAVEEALASADPAHADAFRANLTAYQASLAGLDAEMSAGLASCASPYIVTGHRAFAYLADAYSLTQVAISGISPGEEPSAKTLEEVASFARDHGVTTIFFEPNLPDDLARTVADEVGVTTAVLDPIESPSRDQLDAGATYESLMRADLAALRRALGCT